MRKYLSTLHQRPDHHKKRFAFLVSAGVTLTMFTVWSLVTFGVGGTLAQNPSTSSGQAINNVQKEVSPLESFQDSLASSFEAIKESLGSLNGDYTEMRDNVLNTYGQ